MIIYVDADGCPVTRLVAKIAKEYKIDCTVVCDSAHIINIDGVNVITASTGADSVDFTIVNIIKPGDIVVTQDYGLAAMCLSRGALPINQNGLIFDDSNIEPLLNSRAMYSKIRRAGGRHKGPPPRTADADKKFESALRSLLG